MAHQRFNQRRDRSYSNRTQTESSSLVHTKKVLKNISEFETLSEYSPEAFAGIDGDAHKIALEIKNSVKTNQLRKIFTELKSIERDSKSDCFVDTQMQLLLLQPKLIYAAGRSLIPNDFASLIASLTPKVKSPQDLKILIDFFSAIIAYHKYVGGRD